MVFQSGLITLPCSVEVCHKYVKSNPDQSDRISGRSGLFCCQKKSQKCFVLTTALKMKKESMTRNISILSQNEQVQIHFKTTDNPCSIGYTIQATQLCIWKCQTFYEGLMRIIVPKQEWSFSTEETEVMNDMEELSWFALYEVDPASLPGRFWVQIHYIQPPYSTVKSGNQVLTRSYPFGPTTSEIFSDTLSSGIISNIDYKTSSLFLIDARCLPGSEGGGVYLDDCDMNMRSEKQLIGMIVAPLCWKNEELIGFTICCSIREIISSLLCECCDDPNLVKENQLLEMVSILELWLKDLSRLSWSSAKTTRRSSEPDILRVTCGDLWGSGVVVGAKLVQDLTAEVYVVTCRHVIKCNLEKNFSPVYLNFDGSARRHHGRVLFSTEEDNCFDLALISVFCEAEMLQQLFLEKFATLVGGKYIKNLYAVPHIVKHCYYRKGDPVYVKGHCLFDASNLLPSVSEGILSSVVKTSYDEVIPTTIQHKGKAKDKIPVLLHSTCTVHKGASGGGLICGRTSKLKGLVINHVRDEERKVSYPHVNFSIPACVFMPAVLNYLKTESKSCLDVLNCRSNVIQNIWRLNDEQETTEVDNSVLRSKL